MTLGSETTGLFEAFILFDWSKTSLNTMKKEAQLARCSKFAFQMVNVSFNLSITMKVYEKIYVA